MHVLLILAHGEAAIGDAIAWLAAILFAFALGIVAMSAPALSRWCADASDRREGAKRRRVVFGLYVGLLAMGGFAVWVFVTFKY